MSIRHTSITVEPFTHLLDLETLAFNLYSKYIEELQDEELIQMFSFIKNQEKGHMEIAKKLIELVQ